MSEFTSTRLSDVEAYCALVSKAEGYPKQGTQVGGGIHVPPELGVTHRHSEPVKHPDRDEWRAPVDVKSFAAQTSKTLTIAEKNSLVVAVTAAKEIDATWTPKPVVVDPKLAEETPVEEIPKP